MTKHFILSLILLLICALNSSAQIDHKSALFTELKEQDSTFFERGFNQCDFAYLESHISENLVFYHDQSGKQNREAFLENTKNFICSDQDQKPIRRLHEGSLEVFPLYDNGQLYGALQQGIHHFFIQETGKEDVPTSTAKFTHVWLQKNGTWQLGEVLSYDHHEPSAEKPLDNIAQLLRKSNVPALGLGIIEEGQLTKVEVYGTLDKQAKAPYNTIFKVASLTKPIVAMVALKLVDQGLLALDEPLHPFWIDQDLVDDPRHKKLTPRLILTHQTGFLNWRYMDANNQLVFQFDPGTRHQYSGEGFEYLRKAIEVKLDKSMEELAAELLFTPLGMLDTRFWWDDQLDEVRYAQNFDADGNKIPTAKYYEANAAANLLTTVEDYGLFLAHVLQGASLSEHLYGEMIKPQVELGEHSFFGLGWEVLTEFSDGEFALLHTGKDPGVSTLAILFPESKNGYLIFLNGDNVDNVYEWLLTNRLYLGEELWERR